MTELRFRITDGCHLCKPYLEKLSKLPAIKASGVITNPKVPFGAALVLTPDINPSGVLLGFHVMFVDAKQITGTGPTINENLDDEDPIPCRSCGSLELPLFPNHLCPECWIPGEDEPDV